MLVLLINELYSLQCPNCSSIQDSIQKMFYIGIVFTLLQWMCFTSTIFERFGYVAVTHPTHSKSVRCKSSNFQKLLSFFYSSVQWYQDVSNMCFIRNLCIILSVCKRHAHGSTLEKLQHWQRVKNCFFQARVLFGLIVLIQIALLVVFRYLQKPALRGMNQCLSVFQKI